MACAAPLVAALVLAFHGGGYFMSSWGIACVVLLGVAGIVPHLARGGVGGPWGIAATAGWVGLAAWQGLSSLWADEPSAAMTAMALTALYAAAFAATMLGVRRPGWAAHVADGAMLVAAVVCAYACCARMLPGLVGGDEEARLSTPISYWNGLGALAALGLVLAIGLAGHAGRHLAARAGAAALVPLFALTLLFTLSRGAMLALLAGLVLLVALAPGRLETVAAGLLTLGASLPVLAIANGEEGLVALKGVLPPHEDEGRRVALLLVLTAVVAALLALGAALGLRRMPAGGRRPAGWVVAALALTAVLGVLVARPPDGGPIAWADRQVDSFTRYAPGERTEGSIADRLAVAAGSGRWQQWQVAGDQWKEAPLAGTGGGDYRFVWNLERPMDQTVQNAHSLYLEVMGESGLIGLALLLLPALAGGWVVARAMWRRVPEARELAIAVAACGTIALHMAGDWDWQLPAVVLPAVALGAAAVRAATLRLDGEESPAAIPRPAAWIVSVPAVLLALLVIGPALSAGDLDESRRLAARGDLVQALDVARRAADRDPQSPAPRLLEANILADLGRPVLSDRAFAAARARSPRDWAILADWASALAARGDLRGARTALRAADRFNPMEPRLATLREVITGDPEG